MKSFCFLCLSLVALIAGCSSQPRPLETGIPDSTISQSQSDDAITFKTSGNLDVDSILLDYDIPGPITLIKKRYAESSAQYAFIVHNTQTKLHKPLAQLFEFNDIQMEEYEAMYNSKKSDSLKTVTPPAEIVGRWIPVFWYKDKPYVVSPCQIYNRFIVTDSSFVRWAMDGISAEPIVAVKKENDGIAFETAGGRDYRLVLKDARNFIYQLSGDDAAYVVPLDKASGLPIIIEHCTVDGGISVDYTFTPPSSR